MKTTKRTVYRERALLVSIPTPKCKWQPVSGGCDVQPSVRPDVTSRRCGVELEQLADSAGAIVVDTVTQVKSRPDVAYHIGRGKTMEIQEIVNRNKIDVVIFDNDLSPAQVYNLEKMIQTKVIDRSELILDIFATQARTQQAKLQVELAQLEYTLPRLKHMWTHFSRIAGGIGIGQRGPGEKQLEMDRRLARERITKLKKEISEISQRRQRESEARSELFCISLIGYTNAGKSTLMNVLTGTECLVEDKLFSTLDTKTQRWNISKNQYVLLSDTVGFIRDLPHHLVASFHATLQEVIHADLLIHIVDISQPNISSHITAVNKVLTELNCTDKNTLLVFNKTDRCDPLDLRVLSRQYPEALFISAKKKTGLEQIYKEVSEIVGRSETEVVFNIPLSDGKLLSYLEAHGKVLQKSFNDTTVKVKVKLQPYLYERINCYLKQPRAKLTGGNYPR